jgi:Na+/serine symporter
MELYYTLFGGINILFIFILIPSALVLLLFSNSDEKKLVRGIVMFTFIILFFVNVPNWFIFKKEQIYITDCLEHATITRFVTVTQATNSNRNIKTTYFFETDKGTYSSSTPHNVNDIICKQIGRTYFILK